MDRKTKNTLRKSGAIFANSALWRNPILTAALGIYPAAAASLTVKTSVAFALMLLLTMTPVCLISCLIGRRIPSWIRPAVVAVCSAALYAPAFLLVNWLVPDVLPLLTLYAPLVITNSLLLSHANDYAPDHKVIAVLADCIGCSVGFAAVAILVSVMRTLWMQRGFWENPVRIPAVEAHPFSALILLGFLAAFLQLLNRRRARRRARRTRERRGQA